MMDPSKKYPRGFEHRTRVAFDRLAEVPRGPGLYVWKFDGVDGLEHWTYHFVGKAQDLHADLASQLSAHSHKNSLRQKLAALLKLPAKRSFFGKVSLSADREVWLSDWMRGNGSCWYFETRSPARLERSWIKSLQAPMNCERGVDPLGLRALHQSLGRSRR
jgi:hypothetical protein